MTNEEYNSFVMFIPKLLYEIMTIDDYKVIMNRLDIPLVSETSDIIKYRSGCHNEDSNMGKPNLCFYKEDRSFYCFSECNCNYNLVTLVEKRFKTIGKTRKRINCVRWICQQLNIPFEFEAEIKHEGATLYNWKINLDKYLCHGQKKKELTVYNDKLLSDPMFDNLYSQEWIDEGISEETMDRYEITYYKRFSQVVIPVRDMLGQLVAIRVRNFNPQFENKYDVFRDIKGNEYKCPTDLVMYGIYQNSFNIQRKKKVIIVESEKSVLMADTMYGTDNNICLALMGSNLSNENAKAIVQLEPNEIIIGIDSDFEVYVNEDGTITYNEEQFDKFNKKVMKIYNMFKPYCSNITCVYNNQDFTDMFKASPFDLGRDRFELLFNNREKLCDD